MSLVGRLRSHDDTQSWQGGYAPYDLVKELVIAVGVITLLAVLFTVLFSSPDDKPSTIAQWSREMPANFVTAAAKELSGTLANSKRYLRIFGNTLQPQRRRAARRVPLPTEMAGRQPSDQYVGRFRHWSAQDGSR